MSNPKAIEFDVSRAILRSTSTDKPLQVEDVQSLRQCLDKQEIAEDTSLQVVEIQGQPVGFVTKELLLFDGAQGSNNSLEWVVTFCPICNAGALFSARIDEQTYHFIPGGIYNAMAILRDVETESYWDVINGVCLHGASEGKQLPRLATLRHMRAREAIIAFPSIEIARLPLTDADKEDAEEEDQFRIAARPEWSSRLANTLTVDDPRLPRFDMGLGIWTSAVARYYSSLTLNAQDNVAIDTLDGRNLLIYIDPESRLPDAFYTEASEAHWYGHILKLNTGQQVQQGTVFDTDNQLMRVERPLQLFQRWYGFAVMFQPCEIYGATP